MYLQFFIAILAVAFITFGLGFVAGFQQGEKSINVRLKYAFLREENARLRLACINLKNRLYKRGIQEPDLTSYEEESEEAV